MPVKEIVKQSEVVAEGVVCILAGRKTATIFSKDLKSRTRVTRRGRREMVVTIGPPNSREREFLKLCKRAKCRPRNPWFGSMKERSTNG